MADGRDHRPARLRRLPRPALRKVGHHSDGSEMGGPPNASSILSNPSTAPIASPTSPAGTRQSRGLIRTNLPPPPPPPPPPPRFAPPHPPPKPPPPPLRLHPPRGDPPPRPDLDHHDSSARALHFPQPVAITPPLLRRPPLQPPPVPEHQNVR